MSQQQFGNYSNVKKKSRDLLLGISFTACQHQQAPGQAFSRQYTGCSSSSTSVMKLVLFNQRQDHVGPETQLSENMLRALLVREGNGAARHCLQLPSQESIRRCRQTWWCLTLMTGNKIVELVICEKGVKFNLVQKLEKYVHKIF